MEKIIDSKSFRDVNAKLNKDSNKQTFMRFTQKKLEEKLSVGNLNSLSDNKYTTRPQQSGGLWGSHPPHKNDLL